MNKLYVYRHKDDTVTIYYSDVFPKSKGIPTFAYEGPIPEGNGILKTDGINLYREEPMPITEEIETEEITASDILNVLTGGVE